MAATLPLGATAVALPAVARPVAVLRLGAMVMTLLTAAPTATALLLEATAVAPLAAARSASALPLRATAVTLLAATQSAEVLAMRAVAMALLAAAPTATAQRADTMAAAPLEATRSAATLLSEGRVVMAPLAAARSLTTRSAGSALAAVNVPPHSAPPPPSRPPARLASETAWPPACRSGRATSARARWPSRRRSGGSFANGPRPVPTTRSCQVASAVVHEAWVLQSFREEALAALGLEAQRSVGSSRLPPKYLLVAVVAMATARLAPSQRRPTLAPSLRSAPPRVPAASRALASLCRRRRPAQPSGWRVSRESSADDSRLSAASAAAVMTEAAPAVRVVTVAEVMAEAATAGTAHRPSRDDQHLRRRPPRVRRSSWSRRWQAVKAVEVTRATAAATLLRLPREVAEAQ